MPNLTLKWAGVVKLHYILQYMGSLRAPIPYPRGLLQAPLIYVLYNNLYDTISAIVDVCIMELSITNLTLK